MNYYVKRQKRQGYGIFFSRGGDAMKRLLTTVKKVVINVAKRSAVMEANTSCPLIGFQPKEPQAVKKLRKF